MPSKSKAKSVAKMLSELSAQLERHFEGETGVRELTDFLRRPELLNLVTLHEDLRRLGKQRKRSGGELFPNASRTEYVKALQEALDEIETLAAADDDANAAYELLASPLLTSFFGVLEDVGHSNFEQDKRRTRKRSDSAEPRQAPIESSLGGGIDDLPKEQPALQPQAEQPQQAVEPRAADNAADNWQSMDELDEFERPQKMVAFFKEPGEPLGITVGTIEWEDENTGNRGLDIVVERILTGSRIDQQRVLQPYDVIREVNGIPIDSPEKLQKVLHKASGEITMKIRSGFYEGSQSAQGTHTYVKALFSYDPQYDGLIPCREAGLKFTVGDVLQVVSQDDPNWWQARQWNSKGRAGLIPSLTLQERRKAFVQSTPDRDAINYKVMGLGLTKRTKKVKMTYKANVAQNFEKSDVTVYMEVARVPPFQRRLVLLLGAPGVGKNSLIGSLIGAQPERYARPIPHTSRPPRPNEIDGERYKFVGQQEMQVDIRSGAYLEHGQLNGHLYGVKIDTLRSMSKMGKVLLIDCPPEKVKLVYTAEFKPYVIFLAAPSFECMKSMYELGTSLGYTVKPKRDEDFRKSIQESTNIERNYRHLFDSVLICDNFDACLEQLNDLLASLETEHQWLPVNWLY